MVVVSKRGQLKRQDKAMTREEAEAFLETAFCGRTGTVGPDGYPYVVPNLFTWQDGQVYLHTARYSGHFLTNVRHSDRVCFEADEAGEVFPYGPVECDTSVTYRSVIVYGRIRVVESPDEKLGFFRAFMDKYAPKDSSGREKGTFPRIDGTIVYAITPDAVTGKQGRLMALSKQWTAPSAGPQPDA